MLVGEGYIQISLQLSVRKFVSGFISPIEWCMLLNSIVGQVDLSLEIVHIELIGTGTNVALCIPVSSDHSE
jgi:hypothetical protein